MDGHPGGGEHKGRCSDPKAGDLPAIGTWPRFIRGSPASVRCGRTIVDAWVWQRRTDPRPRILLCPGRPQRPAPQQPAVDLWTSAVHREFTARPGMRECPSSRCGTKPGRPTFSIKDLNERVLALSVAAAGGMILVEGGMPWTGGGLHCDFAGHWRGEG